ncbi:hypothetical protein JXD20_02100 [Candidatus Peregrinibacteria bacterium]|nr:hypothetical protein [Candidatus Peregrinibacteria bacterium]
MESHHDKNTEVVKKPSEIETVETLLEKKKTEKESESREAVMKSAEGVQTEVADVMAGVEAPKEKISERKGESGNQGDIKAGSAALQAQKAQAAAAFAMRRGLPSEEIMIKKIRTAIQAQIKLELQKANALKKNLTTGSAQEYSSRIAKIRRLQETLKTLLTSTFEAIKSIYFKYFSASGRRKPLDEV